MSSISRRSHGASWLRSRPLDLARFAMLAALPPAIVVQSPQRVALSAAIAVAYAAVAAVTLRRTRANAIVGAYLLVVAGWLALSWLRTRYLLQLDAVQVGYGTSKVVYFIGIVLPTAAAVTVLVDHAMDLRPAAIVQVLIGAAMAAITVVSLGEKILGADRYSWQGNLIALGTVLAVQPWPIRNFKASAVLGVLGVFGVMLASSRQAVLALVVGLLLTAVFWGMSRAITKTGALRYVVLPLALIVLTAGYIATTYVGSVGIHPPWAAGSASQSTQCHCVTDRIVSLETSAGDRDKLLARGVDLVRQHPILGAGVGAFAGVVPDSLHPGQFYAYPHNVPLELAAETGVIGLLLVMVPLLAGWALLFWKGVRATSAPVAALLAVTAVFFTIANVSGDVPSARGLWIFGLVAFKLGVDAMLPQEAAPALREAA